MSIYYCKICDKQHDNDYKILVTCLICGEDVCLDCTEDCDSDICSRCADILNICETTHTPLLKAMNLFLILLFSPIVFAGILYFLIK